MRSLHLTLNSLDEAKLFGLAFALALRAGDVVTFAGPVGAGKTTMIAAMVRALTGDDQASSPSFILWQRYGDRRAINHLDLYRIESESDLPELGLHEAFDSQSITLVEWPERAPSLIPEYALQIRLDGAGDGPRSLTFTTRAL